MKLGGAWPLLPLLGAIVIAAAMCCAILILALRPLLQRHALAQPNARSSHSTPTPQGGGIAVITTSLGVTLLAFSLLNPSSSELSTLWTAVAATALMAVIGAIDDFRTIEIAPRLLMQAGLVGITIAILPAELRIFEMLPWAVERAVLFVGGVWFVNLVNFMDGIDWMTVAETLPIAGGLFVLGLYGALPMYGVIWAAALAGAMIGFAPFNRPVASLFLGDVGSLPLGLALGWLLILLAGGGHLTAALLLPLYYLADATITLLVRAARGEPFWLAHRSHFYQRATLNGFSVRQVVCRVFLINLVLVVLALVSAWYPSLVVKAGTLVVGILLVGSLLMSFAHGKWAS